VTPLETDLLNLFVKPPLTALATNLNTNAAKNIATIEADLGPDGNVVVAVQTFLTKELKSSSPVVEGVEDLLLPELDAGLTLALGAADADVPSAYSAGLGYYNKILSEI
jgi:hypothetical protein